MGLSDKENLARDETSHRSMASLLEVAVPAIPPELVSAAALSRIELLAATLPATLTDRFHLECRLGPFSSRTDLIISITEDGSRILTGSNPVISLDPALRRHPVWAGLTELFRSRQAKAMPLIHPATHIWLEFDLDTEGDDRVPVPGVFVVWTEPMRGEEGWRTLWSCVEQYQRHLLGHPPSQELRGMLSRCVDRLPKSASIFAAGFFPTRRALDLRLCVNGLSAKQMPRYLGAVDWPGSVNDCDRWTELIEAPGVCSDRLLHLDLATSVTPRIGVEVNFRQNGVLRGQQKTRRYLDSLVAAGLCTPSKRRGLDAWPGTKVATLPHELWPSMVVRWVNHVKVTCDQSGTARAKAYLCHGHSPYSPQQGDRVPLSARSVE